MATVNNFADKELIDSLSAITSGILTNIIYDGFFPYYYEKVNTSDTIKFVQIEKFNFFQKLLMIVSIFLLIWFFLAVLIPSIIKTVKILSYKKKKLHSQAAIVTIYNNINKKMQKLIQNNVFILFNNNTNCDITVLSSEISNYINELHMIFCPSKYIQKKVVKSAFRHGNTVNDISKYISYYEFNSLINNIEFIFNLIFQNSNDDLQRKDYHLLYKKINDLKSLNVE